MLDNTSMQDQQYPPYHVQGRWYKFELVSDNTTISLKSSDLASAQLFSPTSTCILFCGYGFQFVDYKVIMHTQGGTATNSNFSPTLRIGSTQEQHIRVGSPDMYDYATVYVFGYFE